MKYEAGQRCPNCVEGELERKEHPRDWKPKQRQTYYFRYWYICNLCGDLFHVEEARVQVAPIRNHSSVYQPPIIHATVSEETFKSESIHPDILKRIVTLYADGGIVGANPSSIGGTWAWCGVDAEGNRIVERGGFVASKGRPVTNNHTEQIAITLALEAMPDGWSGTVCSDSMVALGRVFKGWRENNLPSCISVRSKAAVHRMGQIKTILLQGHPTKSDLAAGVGKKRGYPVSIHNVWCDEECGRQTNKR